MQDKSITILILIIKANQTKKYKKYTLTDMEKREIADKIQVFSRGIQYIMLKGFLLHKIK